ncbi:MAG: ABC transporter ATP-binding protein/permease [Chloroflexota bacterium]|nr:ABC transporter ATP-binding protein/permease [Chloroflexota bacterium]
MQQPRNRDFPSGRNSKTPPADADNKPPETLKARLSEWRRNSRATVAGVPRAFRLVWESHRGYTISMAIFSVLFGIIPTATAWISKLLIDAVVSSVKAGGTGEYVSMVIVLVGAQFGLYIGSSLLQAVRDINQQALQELTAKRVQLMLMEHANRLDLLFFENPQFYDALQQAQREAGYRPTNMVQQMFGLIRSLITFLSMIALISRLGWPVAIAALLAPIPTFIANSRYGWQGYMMSRRQSPDRRRMSYFLDLLTKDTYNKEIKLFGLGDFFISRWNEIANRFYQENRSLVRRRYIMGFVWGSLTTVVTSGTYLFVALQAVAGRLTLGDLTFYTQAVGQVQSSLGSILGGLSDMYESNLYLTNLYNFLDYTPLIQSPAVPRTLELPLTSGLEFRNVTFTYPGKEEPALRNVSFTIRPDEAVALVGQNGAGKTTIVKLLTRLYDPDDGQILLDGHDLKEYSLESLHAATGVIFQDYVTYFFTAAENIGVGRLADMENMAMVESSARKSGADGVIEKLPKGYGTTLGKWFDEGHQLSGGEWQKVALARAFMRDAEILVLDEPTASLDARAEYEIFAQMKELTRGKMAFFISHRFSTVRLADRIFVLENGTISEAGTHTDLLALDGTYAELFNLQAAAYR